ncbi:hypothetical protein HELRODRAFT_86301 [Helobdella robusta]|uniref:Fucosyltransferase n=1 Tax=Helobdella robusta TaxID=6412 RepID=T1G6A1_HELRO|nr:hypothetical protein HELRODRAFT_86301 [Helobdella robusta]ESN95993.1 hypothetical protein HELRODRAFT_86301 [Helobdella robusta]
MKVIFMPNGLDADMVEGQQRFLDHQCPINWCLLTDDHRYKKSADLIFYRDVIIDYGGDIIKGLTMLFMLESPMHTMTFRKDQVVNWTATYRTDSTLNAPYERFTPFSNFTKLPDKPDRNYAKGKTKKVAWFVSNCVAANGRFKYAEQLAQHINVDIYGSCGQLSCTRHREQECFQMLQKDYKFYLSFENSNCKDYITEKFFLNALGNNVLPIVMGARPSDYKRLAPPESFIHVDDFESPEHLAEYLHKLDKDDDLYNSYFRWKGTGEFIDTKFWCRLCSMLHEQASTNTRSWYKLDDWWRGTGVCISPQDSGLWLVNEFLQLSELVSE